MKTVTLRTAQHCADCGAELIVGETVRQYGASFYCLNEHKGIMAPAGQERPRQAAEAPIFDTWPAVLRDAAAVLERAADLLDHKANRER